VYDWLLPRVVFPAYEALRGPSFWAEYHRLRDLEWRTPEEVGESSDARLRRIVRHAARNVPHHREAFRAAGLDAEEIRTAADLVRLPTTTRSSLQRGDPAAVTAEELVARRGLPSRTSGSTGVCLEFYGDTACRAQAIGSYLFFLSWVGCAPWNPRVVVSAPAYAARGQHARRAGWRAQARRLLIGQENHYLAGADLCVNDLQSLVGRLRRGYFIHGYPSYVIRLAAEMLEHELELPHYPAAVVSISETLTGANRTAIERAFRCPVVNHYSSVEVQHVAQSCPDSPSRLHVNSERAVVRVVDEEGRDAAPGTRGRVLITDLANQVMPFINYDVGDTAIAGEPCSCGRGFPVLSGLEGRSMEVIVTTQGRAVAAGAVERLLTFGCGITSRAWEYQAVQTAPDAVALRVVPNPRYDDAFAVDLRRQMGELLGSGMHVTVETVDRIALEPSGKRLVIKPLPREKASVPASSEAS
jgi:phenylacetate-CoA ligase